MSLNRVKVLFVYGPLGGGGTERQFALLIQKMDRRVFDPVVVSIGMTREEAEEHLARHPTLDVPAGARGALNWEEICKYHTYRKLRECAAIHFIPKPSRWSVFGPVRRMRQIVTEEKPTVIFSLNLQGAFYSALAVAGGTACHLVQGVRGLGAEAQVPRGRGRGRRNRRSAKQHLLSLVSGRKTELWVANSGALADYLVACGHRRGDVRVIRNGVPDPAADRESDSPPAKSGVRVGIIGRLYPIKDHETFLVAASLVSPSLPVTFEVIGNGPLEEKLRAEAARLEIKDRVHFRGWVEEASAVLCGLDIVVLTSISEGFNNSIAEAQMMGIPVVTTDAPGCREIVSDGETGFVVPVGDAKAVAGAVGRLASDPDLRRSFGAAARGRAQRLFSVDQMVRSYEQLFLELAGPSPASAAGTR
jgi:glycosyltransferase involved in cell wall biosynthesis